MKKTNLTVAVLLMTCLNYSCYYRNPPERNKIAFNDKIEDVQDSLVKMVSLMNKLPADIKGFNTRYYFRDSVLFINGDPVGKIGSFTADTIRALSNFSNIEKQQFPILANYLQRNYISAGYFDLSANAWLFDYRELAVDDFNDSRNITIFNNNPDSLLSAMFRIMDRKLMTCLVVPVDATIR